MRALAKATPYLEQEEYFTGRQDDDSDTKDAVFNLLHVIRYKRFQSELATVHFCP